MAQWEPKKVDLGQIAKDIGFLLSWAVVFLFLCVILMWILHINITPYQKLLNALSASVGSATETVIDISKIPIVREIAGFVYKLTVYGGGFMAFTLVQAIELLPKFIYRIPEILEGVISEGGTDWKITKTDSKPIVKAKIALNKGYAWALSYVDSLSFWAYVFDFFVCLLAYPPISGVENPLDAIPSLITTIFYKEWSRVSLGNIGLLALTVYGFELGLLTAFAVFDLGKSYIRGKIKRKMKEAKKNAG